MGKRAGKDDGSLGLSRGTARHALAKQRENLRGFLVTAACFGVISYIRNKRTNYMKGEVSEKTRTGVRNADVGPDGLL
jgi:hypothetical protein